MSEPGPLISVSDLAGLGRDAGMVILDCSWHMPAQNRDPEQDFRDGHIPGAQRFDYDRDVADTGSDLPHMLPSPEAFQAADRARGIGPDTLVVCYDNTGIFAAPRGWWMFRAMGHSRVVVLDGGLPAWRLAGQPIEQGEQHSPAPGEFAARPDDGWLRHAAQVKDALDQPGIVIMDARPSPRFRGEEAEPRPGLRSGAMPGAVNLPFGELLADGRMRPAD